MSHLQSVYKCEHEQIYLVIFSNKISLILCDNCLKTKKLVKGDRIFLVSTQKEVTSEFV